MNATFILIVFFALLSAYLASAKSVAVLAIDMQPVFYPGGALSVPGANATNIQYFLVILHKMGYPIVASKDSHPTNHVSFKQWPRHAVKGEQLDNNRFFVGDALFPVVEELAEHIQPKGENPDYDSYSAFFDDGGHDTGLSTYLSSKGYKTLIVLGEAGNYCVKASIIDALNEGFNVLLITDMTNYIPSTPETEEQTLRDINKYAFNRFKTTTSQKFLQNPASFVDFTDYMSLYFDQLRHFL